MQGGKEKGQMDGSRKDRGSGRSGWKRREGMGSEEG